MGNGNSVQNLKTDVACQTEPIYTRPPLKRKHIDTMTGIQADNCSLLVESKSALWCRSCSKLLDTQGKKVVFFKPCKHSLCMHCYYANYWNGDFFSLLAASIKTCHICNMLIESVYTQRDDVRDFRHSLCDLSDYVVFNLQDQTLRYIDLPQIIIPFVFILEHQYFPIKTPHNVRIDITSYLEQQVSTDKSLV